MKEGLKIYKKIPRHCKGKGRRGAEIADRLI
jgi:hypothetical protein